MSYAKIKPRRGTNYEWSTVNPILEEGELGVVVPDTGVGTGLAKFKIGDGVHPYTELPYAFDGAAAAALNGGSVENFHLLQLRAGTTDEWMIINPVLDVNELSYDSTTRAFKVGDGITAWDKLPYTASADMVSGVSDYGDEDTSAGGDTPSTPRFGAGTRLAPRRRPTPVEDPTPEPTVEEPEESSTTEPGATLDDLMSGISTDEPTDTVIEDEDSGDVSFGDSDTTETFEEDDIPLEDDSDSDDEDHTDADFSIDADDPDTLIKP